ncbi:MAG: ribosome maturation factor RimP [Desulfohalobiaceae bacterium]
MSQESLHAQLQELIQPLVQGMGLELWGLELPAAPRGGVFRVYIDSPQGVSVEQCAELSRHLNYLLDVQDPFPGSYTLEVSSPGLDRTFFSLQQMEPYQGREVLLRLKEPLQGRSKWQGRLLGIQAGEVALEPTSGERVSIPWQDIKKAKLVYRPE